MFMFSHSNNHRVFVDLIFRNNRGKYPNLDPRVPLDVGDYGYVGRDTGKFMKEGNIFREHMADGLEKITMPSIPLLHIMAEGTKNLDIDGDGGVNVEGFMECTFKTHYKFSKGYGAVLVMHNPIMTTIDKQGLIKKLFADGRLKKHQAVVTEVHACPSYALLLGGREGGDAFLGFRAAPSSSSQPVQAGLKMGWVGSTTSGEWQWAHGNRNVFFPLCVLGGISPRVGVTDLRHSPMPEDDEPEKLFPYPLPWDPLDEEGNEIPCVDLVPSRDDEDEDD